jgi:beta propeller repeat protein
MKHRRIQGWLSVALLAASFWSGTPVQAEEIGTELKIVPDQPQPSQAGIDLSKNYAVWISETDPDQAITLYDLKEKTETRIVANGTQKSYLKVDGNYVAWIDGRHGGTDVYLYDIAKKTERRLTKGNAVASELDIQGNHVVWTDRRDGKSDIYVYDLTKNEELRVSQSGKASHPTVSNGNVAWEDQRNGNADIYYYSLSNRQEYSATTYRGDQKNPKMVGNEIVYQDSRNNNLEVYKYDIKKGKESRVTDDSDEQQYPQLYGDFVIYLEDNDLKVYNIDDEGNSYIEHNIYDKLMPSIFAEYVLFAKKDEDKKTRLFLYNLDDEEMEPIGGINGEPTQPDGDSRYVVYLNEGKDDTSVVLFDVETKKLSVVSDPETDPQRPLVSNQYVVWYDDDAEALISYDIRKGKTERVSGKDDEPVSDKYELSGNRLFWIDEGNNFTLKVTNLSSGDTEEIKSLRKQPQSIDINDNYLVWVTDEGSEKGKIYLYDLAEEDETEIRKDKVQVEEARLGGNFVVWSEFVDDNWDLYYYDLESRKVKPVLRNAKRDQVHPQAAGDYIFFEDNRNTVGKGQYFQELYNLTEGSFSDMIWSEDAEITEPRMGGNRLVWIDKRDRDKPTVYTLAFVEPEDDDNGGDDGDGYKDYPLTEVLSDGLMPEIVEENDPEDIHFIFYPNTNKVVSISLEAALDDVDTFLQNLNTTPFEDILIRVYR